jgi:hypothetical protein
MRSLMYQRRSDVYYLAFETVKRFSVDGRQMML